MDIQFLGASRMVTGSNYLIRTSNYNIVVDCGMFQGNQEQEKLNFEEFDFDPKDIDYMILTHAHIDHSGRIPKLVKDGFRGKIFSTRATYDLCKIMLLDSAKIQESDVKWENKKRERAGLEMLEPLYTTEDAEDSLRNFTPVFYDQKIVLNKEISLRFKDAGHILGSAILEMWINEEEGTNKIVFSGDLGMPGRPIIKNLEFIDEADYLIMESTYGNINHEAYSESTSKLIEIINKTALRGGTVIIPSFAVGRTQELIYELNRYYEYDKSVEEYMKIPVYIDSPMAVHATEAFQNNSNDFNDEAKSLILKGDNPFIFENLRYIKTQEESMVLNKSKYPKVIISASGMATAGRVRHHLKHNLWDDKNSLVFVGYQAEGTLGRILLNGVKKMKILGEQIDVKSEIYNLEGFSGHADQRTLINWIDNFKIKPKKIFLVHGEIEPATVLADLINEKFKIETIIPNMGDKFGIKKDEFSIKEDRMADPVLMKTDIEREWENVYNQFEALKERSQDATLDDVSDDYNELKNRLIELQHNLMDLNILLGK